MDKHEDTDAEKTVELDGQRSQGAPSGEGATGAIPEVPEVEKTLEQPTPAEPATEKLPGGRKPAASSAPSDGDRPHLRDVTGVTGSYLRAKFGEFLASCKKHKGACLGLGALAVVAIGFLVAAGIHARNVPDPTFVEKDARARLEAPDYAPGDFGSSDTLYISDVHVDSERRVVRTSDSAQAQFGASGYAEAHVTATFGNGSVVATKTATLSYAKVGSEWQAIGAEADASVSYEAVAGVEKARIMANLPTLLARADDALSAAAKTAGDGGASAAAAGAGESELGLAQIYASSRVTVTSEDFDEQGQTEAVGITCVKASSFESYTCQMTAHFAFRPVNGVWELEPVDVNDDAKVRTFQPLVGTWEGTFQSQETDGAKCLAAGSDANGAPTLKVTVDSAEVGDTDGGSGTRLTGTIDALAHFHDHPATDAANCDGDEQLTDVKLVANYYGGHNGDVDSDIAFVATLPEEVGGTVTVTLGFGTGSDPTQAVARVQTSYPHKGTFLFIQYDQTVTYTDVYLLRKVS